MAEFCFASLSLLVSGRQYMLMPVAFAKRVSSTRWQAYLEPQDLDLHRLSIFISSPASASVANYRFELFMSKHGKWRRCMFGKFILLCNPWCPGEFLG